MSVQMPYLPSCVSNVSILLGSMVHQHAKVDSDCEYRWPGLWKGFGSMHTISGMYLLKHLMLLTILELSQLLQAV